MTQNSSSHFSSSLDSHRMSRFPGIRFNSGVKKSQLSVYSRQLSTLLKAGVPIVQALKVLQKQETQGAIATVITEQISELEGGSSFSATLRAYPRVFDRMYVSLVVAGEEAGVLEQVMERLAYYLERSVQTAGKIRSAMIYPVVVMCASVLIVSGLLIFVVPQFEVIFESMLQGAALPVMTRWLLDLSRLLQDSWWWFIVGGFIFYLMVQFLLGVPAVRMFYDRLKLMIPAFGTILKKATLARFCRTFGTLLESAVPILNAIDTSSRTMNNQVMESALERVKTKVRDGESVASSFDFESVIPPMMAGMVEVGEASGELPAMLLQIAETYEQEVEAGVNGLTTLIEPLMILALAVVIGFLVIALFLPIVEIMQNLGN